MTIPYRTRRMLRRVGLVALALLLVSILTWLCWVVWLERYVVYSREGATLDFELPPQSFNGVVASPPAAKGSVSIYYNEGADAVELTKELTPLNGYYIDYATLSGNIAGAFDDLKHLQPGTPVMIELKGDYGTFYYSTGLSGAALSASVPISTVDELIKELKTRGFYLIAKVSAFRDYDFGNKNVFSGLYMKSRAGLWMDSGGYFWLDPTSANTIGWLTSIINELKGMGFHEVMLANFRFPAETDKYIFNGNMEEALATAAQTLFTSTHSDTFTLSFGATTAAFPLPEGRSRVYLENVDASNVRNMAEQATMENPDSRMVFLCATNDTRFDAYSVLRPLSVAEVMEAQKAEAAAQAENLAQNQ